MYDVSESMLTATWWAIVRKMCRVLSPETSAVSGISMKVTGCKYPTQADCFKKNKLLLQALFLISIKSINCHLHSKLIIVIIG